MLDASENLLERINVNRVSFVRKCVFFAPYCFRVGNIPNLHPAQKPCIAQNDAQKTTNNDKTTLKVSRKRPSYQQMIENNTSKGLTVDICNFDIICGYFQRNKIYTTRGPFRPKTIGKNIINNS